MRALLTLLVCMSLSGTAAAAEVVPWLYEVAVPVENQSDAERSRGSSVGLLALLTRLTGLAYVPRTPEVTEALAGADRYYNEFRFARTPEDQLQLVVQFDPEPVQGLIRAAGLPVWRAQRERVLVWAVVSQDGERELIGATSALPLVVGLKERARDRGLPLTLPLLDLEDQLAVDPAAVWGRLSQVVDPASQRYGADVLLLGRVSPGVDGAWDSDWEFWVDGVVVPFALESADLMEHGLQAVDVLANELAGRRVVLGRQAGQLSLAVSGIRTPEDYGALLNYLRSLEFVQNVGVSDLRRGSLVLLVDTSAEPDRLLAIFERDQQLFNDQLALLDSADLRLVWRGGD